MECAAFPLNASFPLMCDISYYVGFVLSDSENIRFRFSYNVGIFFSCIDVVVGVDNNKTVLTC